MPHPSKPDGPPRAGQGPVAKRDPVVRTLHGEEIEDPYGWLRDENWRDVMRDPAVLAPAIRAHLDAENAHLEAALGHTRELRERLVAEMRGRIKEDDSSVPATDGEFAYYHRYASGGEHPIFCREPRAAPGTETVLLDGDEQASGHDYCHIAACEHGPDHRIVGFSIDLNGSEIYTVRFRDLDTGELLDDVLENAQGGFVFANDSRTVFYTVLDADHRPSRVYRHTLGTATTDDILVYEEPDPGFFVGVGITESRKFVVIDAHDHTTSEVRLLDADTPHTAPVLVAPRERDVEYSVSHHGQQLVILTNAGAAEDFKLVTAPVGGAGRAGWEDLVPHRPGTLRVGYGVFADFLVRLEREDGLPRIVIREWASGAEHEIRFDEQAYSLGLVPGYEFDTHAMRFAYSSPTTPQQTFDYDMATRERRLRKTQEVPSGHDASHYRAQRLYAPGHDGETVPVTLLHRHDTALDGSAPVLLYGYGAYGHSIPAAFGTSRLSLVDRGFIYAIAHVRGGTERGYRWYREGKLRAKKNTFLDFVAAAEHLVDQGLARPGRIACHGGSAGGLLIGAVTNMRPDLFGAAVGEVPFVDVLNTMSDASLPLTPPEWPEWGNPIEDPEAFRCILEYSPYDNVRAQDYPHILATAGLTDPRVTYWEPAKWIARLRERRTDNGLNLLRTNMSAGHGGAAGRFEQLAETAWIYAFVLHVFGLASEPAADPR